VYFIFNKVHEDKLTRRLAINPCDFRFAKFALGEAERCGVTTAVVPGLCGDMKVFRAVRSGSDSYRTVRNSAIIGPPQINHRREVYAL